MLYTLINFNYHLIIFLLHLCFLVIDIFIFAILNFSKMLTHDRIRIGGKSYKDLVSKASKPL